MAHTHTNHLLRLLPGVDSLLDTAARTEALQQIPRGVLVSCIRQVLEATRKNILADQISTIDETTLIQMITRMALQHVKPRLVTVINATGVVLHTNMGRALLCQEALDNIRTIAGSYSNLEFNLEKGKRGLRYEAVEDLICELTGAQSAIAVNNNAGAVLLSLNTLANGQAVIVSRGELVEIGGSFRIPDVMIKSGCILKETGTTNRTHPKDYENAISDNTALLLKVHASNYTIDGFTASVSIDELVSIGKRYQIPVMEDLGSGTLIDFSKYGLPKEPTVAEAVASGADVVTFSGDKLLGGPQAGIIAGRKSAIDRIKSNPLTRALRIDKLTLAALESTLNLYRDEKKAIRLIPTLEMLTRSYDSICRQADDLMARIKKKIHTQAHIELVDLSSRPGGGSFPDLTLPSRCVTITPETISVSRLEKQMRQSCPAIIGRIENDRYILDPRTIQDGQGQIIADTLETILLRGTNDGTTQICL